jgi:hypothetical protein
MGRVTNKRRERMEKVLALVLPAALPLGERLRDGLFGGPGAPSRACASANREKKGASNSKQGSKWRRNSGVFALLKGHRPMPAEVRETAVRQALVSFAASVLPSVSTHVPP